MKLDGCITGIGWVRKDSMGNRTRAWKFDLNKGRHTIQRKDVLDYPYKPFGRMDEFSKSGFAAIAFALDDAKINWERKNRNISLIASTATGCIRTDISYWKTVTAGAPSPAVFAYTLDSCFLGEAAICFGLTGESFIINEKNINGLTGLFFALEALNSGSCEIALCGIINSDILVKDSKILKIAAGALFFVIEKRPDRELFRVTAESPNSIYAGHMDRLSDLYDLVGRCFTENNQKD